MLFAFALSVLTLVACESPSVREVGDWTAVENDSAAKLRFDALDATRAQHPHWVTVDCPGNAAISVETVVLAGTLHVRGDDDGALASCEVVVPAATLHHLRVSGSGDVVSDAIFSELQSIDVTGKGNVELAAVTSPEIEIWVRGGGNVDIAWLATDSATVDLSGTGEMYAAGAVTDGWLAVSGTGDFWGADLVFTHLEADLSGSGNAEVNVSGAAELIVSGSGSATVSGEGTIDVLATGSGDVDFVD